MYIFDRTLGLLSSGVSRRTTLIGLVPSLTSLISHSYLYPYWKLESGHEKKSFTPVELKFSSEASCWQLITKTKKAIPKKADVIFINPNYLLK